MRNALVFVLLLSLAACQQTSVAEKTPPAGQSQNASEQASRTTQATAPQPTPTITPQAANAAQDFTGQYELKNGSRENSLDVQVMPNNQVKFYLYASWIGNAETGNVRVGEAQGIVPLRGDTAIYESERCRITIKFQPRRAIVEQGGSDLDCDFGMNVSADGTYGKTSNNPPKFDF